jgi:hypothetical protein
MVLGVGGAFPGDVTCLIAGTIDEPWVEEPGVWEEFTESTI